MQINQYRFSKTGILILLLIIGISIYSGIVLHIKMVEEMTKANYSEY